MKSLKYTRRDLFSMNQFNQLKLEANKQISD